MERDISSILAFLVDLAYYFSCPFPLPPNLSIAVTKKEVTGTGAKNKTTFYKITKDEQALLNEQQKPLLETGKIMNQDMNQIYNVDNSISSIFDTFDKLLNSTDQFIQVKEVNFISL